MNSASDAETPTCSWSAENFEYAAYVWNPVGKQKWIPPWVLFLEIQPIFAEGARNLTVGRHSLLTAGHILELHDILPLCVSFGTTPCNQAIEKENTIVATSRVNRELAPDSREYVISGTVGEWPEGLRPPWGLPATKSEAHGLPAVQCNMQSSRGSPCVCLKLTGLP